MALTSKLRKIGIPARQASALGFITEELTAAGTIQSNATQVLESFVLVKGADDAAGVKMMTYDMSKSGVHFLVNADSVKSFVLYPALGQRINLLGANAGIVIPGNNHVVVYLCDFLVTGTTWMAFVSSQPVAD